MSMSRKIVRAAKHRTDAARRLETRAARRAEPQRLADRRSEQAARAAEHREWLASLTPEQRGRYDRREKQRMEGMMQICAPALLGALAMAALG